jgi:hypothetical protein
MKGNVLKISLFARIAALVLVSAPAFAGEIVTFDGVIKSDVKSIAPENGKLVLVHSSGKVDCSEVVSVSFGAPAKESSSAAQVHVMLSSGDCIKGAIAGGNEEKMLVTTEALGNVSLSLEGVRMFCFPANVEANYATFVENVLTEAAGDPDLIVLSTGHKITGSLMSVGPVSAIIEEKNTKAKLTVEYSKIAAVRLYNDKTPKPPEGLRALCRLSDGCELDGALKGYSNGELTLATSVAGEVRVKSALIETLVFRGEHFTFLSDMTPAAVKETAYIQPVDKPAAFFYSMKRDRTVVGGKTLSIRGRQFLKGLGMMAETSASYNLDGKYKTFHATIGLDDEGKKGLGLVDFVVEGDGKVLFRRDKVTMKDISIEAKVDITGVKTLKITAAFHVDPDNVSADKRVDSGPAENWAVWGNALVRK